MPVNAHFYLSYKKNSTCGGKAAPGYFAKKTTQVEKKPEPLPNITQCHCSPCETINDLGRILDLYFDAGDKGIFFLTPA